MEYACALAGLVLVTANPAYQAAELRYVLEQSGSVALFQVESHRGNPMAEIGAAACDGLDAVREIVDMDDHDGAAPHGRRRPPCPTCRRTMPRRSSTPPAPPASRRARCCPIAA